MSTVFCCSAVYNFNTENARTHIIHFNCNGTHDAPNMWSNYTQCAYTYIHLFELLIMCHLGMGNENDTDNKETITAAIADATVVKHTFSICVRYGTQMHGTVFFIDIYIFL